MGSGRESAADPSLAGKYGHPAEVSEFTARAARGLNPAEACLIKRHLAPGAEVLDVGCAAGRVALALNADGFDVTATDLCVPMLRAVPVGSSHGGQWVQADARQLPFGAGTFDAVLLLDQFVDQFHGQRVRVELLRKAGRLLRPGGVVLVSMHNRIWTPGVGRLAWMAWRRGATARAPTSETRAARPAANSEQLPGSPTEQVFGLAGRAAQSRPLRAVGRRAVAMARGRLWVHRTNLLRRLARAWPVRRYGLAEPGDFWLAQVSGAQSPGHMPFHHYDCAEFAGDVRRAGLQVLHRYDPLELERDTAFPRWVQRNAPRLYWVLGRDLRRLGG